MKKLSHMKKNTSFTLIELLVVIVIIGVLAGVIMVTTSSSVNNATLARAKAFSSSVQNSMLLNLVAQYELENDASDSWGYHDGTASGTINYNTTGFDGKANGAAYFNGSACIRAKDDPDFNFGSQMSAFVWVKGASQSTFILSKFDTSHKRAWAIATVNSNNFRVRVMEDGDAVVQKQYNGSSVVFNNTWHLIGFTWDSGTLKLYADGAQETVTKGDDGTFTTIYNSSADVTIGCYLVDASPTSYFTGSLDDVRLYNVTLSSSQIKQNYIAGLNSLLSKGQISEEEYNQKLSELALR